MCIHTAQRFISAFGVILITTTIVACSSPGGSNAPEPAGIVPAPVVGFSPADLPRSVSKAPAVTFQGSEYADWLPHNRIEVEDTSLWYKPDFEPGGYSPGGLSYAIYEANVFGLEVEGLLTTYWAEHWDAADLLFGIANFTENRWDWFRIDELTAEGKAQVDFELTGHVQEIGPDEERMLVMPLLLGVDEWLLNEVHLGGYLVIDSVYPRWGMAGETFQPAVFLAGVGPYEYAWDFGDGATPSTSTEASPVVTAGEPGTYQASVTVTSDYGADTFEFELLVYEDSADWSHTWLGMRGLDCTSANGWIVATDAAGNIYQLGNQGRIDSERGIIWLVKYNHAGMELWNRCWTTEFTAAGSGMVLDSDGNVVILAGATTKYDGYLTIEKVIYLLKFSPTGDLISESGYFQADEVMIAQSIAAGQDGCVHVSTTCPGDDHQVILKIDRNGDVAWAKSHGNEQDSGSWYVINADDQGNIYFTGNTSDEETSGDPYFIGDSYLVKLDPEGNKLWEVCWGTPCNDNSRQISIAPNGSIDVVGETWFDGLDPGRFDLYLARISPAGDVTSLRSYTADGKNRQGRMAYTDNGTWLVFQACTTLNENLTSILLKLQENGDIESSTYWNAATPAGITDVTSCGGNALLFSGSLSSAEGTWEATSTPVVSPTEIVEKSFTGTMSDFSCTRFAPEGRLSSATDVWIDVFVYEYFYSMGLIKHTVE